MPSASDSVADLSDQAAASVGIGENAGADEEEEEVVEEEEEEVEEVEEEEEENDGEEYIVEEVEVEVEAEDGDEEEVEEEVVVMEEEEVEEEVEEEEEVEVEEEEEEGGEEYIVEEVEVDEEGVEEEEEEVVEEVVVEEEVEEEDEKESGGEEVVGEVKVEDGAEEEEEEEEAVAAEVEDGAEEEEEEEAVAAMEDDEMVVEEEEKAVAEEVGEEEEEGGDEDQGGATNETIKSEEPGEGLETVFSTPERSKEFSAATTHGIDGSSGKHTAYDPSDDTHNTFQIEKEPPIIAPEGNRDAQDSRSRLVREKAVVTTGSQSHLILDDSTCTENATSIPGYEMGAENRTESFDASIDKEAHDPYTNSKSQLPESSRLPSLQILQRRPRSSSPGEILENANKKPAIICSFFARGWCIKGKSCRFLHQKEEAIHISQQMEENLVGTSTRGYFLNGAGATGKTERSKLSSAEGLLHPPHIDSSSKSPFLSQRALVQAYGGESDGLSKSHDGYNVPGMGNIRRELPGVDILQNGLQTSVQKDYTRPFGLSPRLEIMDERKLDGNNTISTRYLNERELHRDMIGRESLIDSPFTGGFALGRNTSLPEYRSYSGDRSAASAFNLNHNETLSYAKRTDGPLISDQRTHIPIHDSYSSYGASRSRNSSYSYPLHSVQISPFRGLPPLGAEHLDTHKPLDSDIQSYGSRSSLLTNSSRYSEVVPHHSIPRNLPSVGQKAEFQDAWEPSKPFRPSFIGLSGKTSRPGSQYDPLLDSIDTSVTGNTRFQIPQSADVSTDHMNGIPNLSSHTSGSNAHNTLNYSSLPHEGMLAKNISEHESSGYKNDLVATPRLSMIDRGNISMSKEEENRIADHVLDRSEAGLGDNLGNLEDKDKNNQESKALKFFRPALVDFVKELVKPYWREGHLSKDVHKTIVKKTVEKVLNALHPLQVPSTTEALHQYLSISRPKLVKLIDGYVERYAKS